MADITLLHPLLLPLYNELIADLASLGINAHATQTYRTPDAQQALVDEGITKVCPSHDKHCFTLEDGTPAAKAFDLAVIDDKTGYVTDGTDRRYSSAGSLWRQYAAQNPELGLVWGQDFIHAKPDPDHFQMT